MNWEIDEDRRHDVGTVLPHTHGPCGATEDVGLRGAGIHMNVKMKCNCWLVGEAMHFQHPVTVLGGGRNRRE